MSRMTTNAAKPWAAVLLPLLLLACSPAVDGARDDDAIGFPRPDRPVSKLGANQYSTEASRDEAGEATTVMDRANITPGMSVADIGAGNGYYTVRLAERVGQRGRVLAQDIDPEAIEALATRVQRERIDNVSVITGRPSDPRLPEASFDRIFLVHMYHEVSEPYAFLWHLWPALKKGGEVIVVDRRAPTDRHGIMPRLLFCELDAVGFELSQFSEQPELGSYYASFTRSAVRPEPDAIEKCDYDSEVGA